jgi:predicted amidophosphoribosyltransferase
VAAEPICPACATGLGAPSALTPPPGLDWCVAAFSYEGAVAKVVTGIKNRGRHAALAWLADAVASRLVAEPGARALDALTWAPTTAARRRARGSDHAQLLAVAVGRRVGLPVRRLLRREPGPSQTGRSRAARADVGFTAVSAPARVLVVDDVTTTGSTLAAAAGALRAAGSVLVAGAVAARTPPSERARQGVSSGSMAPRVTVDDG